MAPKDGCHRPLRLLRQVIPDDADPIRTIGPRPRGGISDSLKSSTTSFCCATLSCEGRKSMKTRTTLAILSLTAVALLSLTTRPASAGLASGISVVPSPVSTGEFCEQLICTGSSCSGGITKIWGLNRYYCHGSSIWVNGTCYNTYEGPCRMAQYMTGPACAPPAVSAAWVYSTSTFCGL